MRLGVSLSFAGSPDTTAAVAPNPDHLLAQRLAGGDALAWRTWVPACRTLLDRIAARAGLPADDRADLAQDVLVELWSHRTTLFLAYRGEASLLTFVYPRLAWRVRSAVMADRRRHERMTLLPTAVPEPQPFAKGNPAAATLPRDARVGAMVDALPPRQRQVVRLATSGLSWSRVAAVAGVSRDAARKSFAKALRSLRSRSTGSPPIA
jgi:RNA polymerase sigma factor (sigma-70 family)